eukprot:4466114-Alexandrium_andersonii.AAC.1
MALARSARTCRCVAHAHAQHACLACRARACRKCPSGYVLRICALTACGEHSREPSCVPVACQALRVAHARALD